MTYEGGGGDRGVDDTARRFRRWKNHTAAPAMARTIAPPTTIPAIAPPDNVGETDAERLAAGEVADETEEVVGDVTGAAEELGVEDVDDVGKATSSRLVTLRAILAVDEGSDADNDVKVSFSKAPLTLAMGFDAVYQQMLACPSRWEEVSAMRDSDQSWVRTWYPIPGRAEQTSLSLRQQNPAPQAFCIDPADMEQL